MHWFLVSVGLVLLVVESSEVWRGWRARRWPTTTGEFVDVALEWAGVRRAAHLAVRYRYEVGGASYESSRVRFGAQPTRSRYRAPRALAQGMAPGRPVRVHYNPRAPADAVLRPGVSAADVVILLVGISLLVIGIRG